MRAQRLHLILIMCDIKIKLLQNVRVVIIIKFQIDAKII